MDVHDFADRYDCVVICGCFRFGSTALSLKMTSWLQEDGYKTLWLNEFFTGHHFLRYAEDGQLKSGYMPDDYLSVDDSVPITLHMQRPIPDNIMRLKLNWLKNAMGKTKLVLKVDPQDWVGPTGQMLETFIFDNPRVYKIGLNRQDVGNAVISYLIGNQFNFWGHNQAELREEHDRIIQPVAAKLPLIQDLWNHMLLHNTWLWYMHGRIDTLVWYDQIEDLQIPQIGLMSNPTTWSTKNTMPHEDRLKKYFSNHGDVARIAAGIQRNLDGLIAAVRQQYRI